MLKRKAKILKSLLTSVSVLSVVAGSDAALAATNRFAVEANVKLSTGLNDVGAIRGIRGITTVGGKVPFVNDSTISIMTPTTIDADINDAVIGTIDTWGSTYYLVGHTSQLNIKENTSVGSIYDSAMIARGVLNISISAGKTLTLTGKGEAIPDHTAQYGGYTARNIPYNSYAALREIDLGGNGVLNVESDNGGKIIFDTNTKVKSTNNATLNVNSDLEIKDHSFTQVKTINIGDNKTLSFSTNPAANELKLMNVADDTINFNQDSKLVLTDPKITVGNSSLGGGVDRHGVVELNMKGKTEFAHAKAKGDVALIGIDETHRAKKFTVNTGGYNLEMTGKIYSKELELNGGNGKVTFNNKVDVGAGGSTKFATKTTAVVKTSSNFGDVDFNGTNSTISVTDKQKLSGNFIGNVAGAASSNTIIFEGSGELIGTATRLKELKLQGKAATKVTLSGKNSIEEVTLESKNALLVLNNGFELTGNINNNAASKGYGTIDVKGNAKIIGNIGDKYSIGNLRLADDATKTLEVTGDTIHINSIEIQNSGGTLKLTNNTNDVNIKANFGIVANNTGVIDADNLANTKRLTIDGKIGDIGANQALGKISLASGADLKLTGRDANISEIKIGDDTEIFLAGNNSYRIAKTINNFDKGIVYLYGDLTLEAGTNLGSSAAPLECIVLGNRNNTITIKENVELHANLLENLTAAKAASLKFDGNGKSIINAVIGHNSDLDKLTIGADAIVELKQAAYFKGATTLEGANSRLIIGGEFKVDKIESKVGSQGVLEFNNAADIDVEVVKQAAPTNTIAELRVAGDNVTITQTGAGAHHGIRPEAINFTNDLVDATLTMPEGYKLDGINVDNTAGNAKRHTIITSGIPGGGAFRQTIDAANHIGNNDANRVNLSLGGDNDILEVKTADFYSSVTTEQAGKNEVIFDVAAGGKVYGLGENGKKLAKVTFIKNTENSGDTYVKESVIHENVEVKFGGTIDTKLQLGFVDGVDAKAIFKDGSKLEKNIITLRNNEGVATFEGAALIKKDIGSKGKALQLVEFTGNKDVALRGNIYAKNIEFGNSNITVPTSTVGLIFAPELHGKTKINGNIDLKNSSLTFVDGDATLEADTSFKTTFAADKNLGHIIAESKVTIDPAVRAKAVEIEDSAALGNGKYTFVDIKGVGSVEFTDGRHELPSIKTNQAYSKWTLEVGAADNNIYAKREDISNVVIKADIAHLPQSEQDRIQGPQGDNQLQNILPKVGNLATSELRGESLARYTTTTEAQVNDEQIHIQDHVTYVLLDRTMPSLRRGIGAAAAASAGDESEMSTVFGRYLFITNQAKSGSIDQLVIMLKLPGQYLGLMFYQMMIHCLVRQ